MSTPEFDSIVIGAGSARLAYAQTAAKLGANVLLVERDALGGTCVNRECVPKKVLWAASGIARSATHTAQQGISTDISFDFKKLVAKRDAHIRSINASFETSLEDVGVTLIRGDATLLNAHSVRIRDEVFTASHIILATGGRPSKMDIEGAQHVMDSRDVLEWTTLPARMMIVGGGYIGCEFAAIFTALGVKVTLVHDGAHILDSFAETMAKHVQSGLEAAGIDLLTENGLESVSKRGGEFDCLLKPGQTLTVDAVVAAVGRTPNIEQLGPFSGRLETVSNGALAVTAQFATNVAGIYAIGDVADRLPLTPVATADVTALAHMLHCDGAATVDLDLVATTTFVYPPAAFVGSVGDAPELAGKVVALVQNILAPDSARAPDFYKIGFDEATGAMTGAPIISDSAPDLIALCAALIAAKAPASAFTEATAIHPSFAEEFFGD